MLHKVIALSEHAKLHVYVSDIRMNPEPRDGLLIIPGGGYRFVSMDREGEPMALTFCDYASAGSDLAACLRVWFPCPLYTDGLFFGGTKRVVNPFAAEEPQDTLSGSTL